MAEQFIRIEGVHIDLSAAGEQGVKGVFDGIAEGKQAAAYALLNDEVAKYAQQQPLTLSVEKAGTSKDVKVDKIEVPETPPSKKGKG